MGPARRPLPPTLRPPPPVPQLLRPLGTVAACLAPNSAHCLWGAAMRDAWPGAVLAGPPKAAERFPALRWDVVVAEAADLTELLERQGFDASVLQAWTTAAGACLIAAAGCKGTALAAGCGSGPSVPTPPLSACAGMAWLQEVAVLHRPSRSLVLTDLAFNFRPAGGACHLSAGGAAPAPPSRAASTSADCAPCRPPQSRRCRAGCWAG